MPTNASQEARLETLERELAAVRTQLAGVTGRDILLTHPQQARIAMTFEAYEGAYPTEPANTYPIRFLDTSLSAWTAGNRTATHTPRSASEQVVAHAIHDGYIEKNELVTVIKIRTRTQGERWIIIDKITTSGGSGVEATAVKAKVSTGSYPTFQTWSEATSGQQTVWEFITGTIDHDVGSASGVATFTESSGPPVYRKAYNLSKWHYIPEGTILELVTINGKYYVDHKAPPVLFGTLDADLGTSYALVSLDAEATIGTGKKCRGYANQIDTGYVLLAGTSVTLARHVGTDAISYRVISANQCPVEVEE